MLITLYMALIVQGMALLKTKVKMCTCIDYRVAIYLYLVVTKIIMQARFDTDRKILTYLYINKQEQLYP